MNVRIWAQTLKPIHSGPIYGPDVTRPSFVIYKKKIQIKKLKENKKTQNQKWKNSWTNDYRIPDPRLNKQNKSIGTPAVYCHWHVYAFSCNSSFACLFILGEVRICNNGSSQ